MKNIKDVVKTVERPIKVLQFGEGNFLRAFVDWIIDQLNEKKFSKFIEYIDEGIIFLKNLVYFSEQNNSPSTDAFPRLH